MRDSDGNQTWTETDKTYAGVAVYPRESVELIQGQDTNISGLVAVFKPAITVSPTDQITVRSERYEIDGEPGQFRSPFTGTTVTKLNLTRVEG
jgi:hypothetical protein